MRTSPKTAFIFPGQASQRAGMATEILEHKSFARELFDRAGEILGIDLAGVCTTGNDQILTRTDIAQPALLTTCLAWLAALEERGMAPDIVAGHSLGEFSAWVASGALEFETALRLVRRRSELMEDAAQRNPGGMIAVIGLRDEQVVSLCEKARTAGIVVPANYNAPGQLVVSGEPDGLQEVARLAKTLRGKTIPLRVSGAFHSPLMDDAAHQFSLLLATTPISEPRIPVIANVSAEPVTDADAVRAAISRQMTTPVRWTQSMQRMIADGVGVFIEVGPNQVLTKLTPRISADVKAISIGSTSELEAAVQEVMS